MEWINDQVKPTRGRWFNDPRKLALQNKMETNTRETGDEWDGMNKAVIRSVTFTKLRLLRFN